LVFIEPFLTAKPNNEDNNFARSTGKRFLLQHCWF